MKHDSIPIVNLIPIQRIAQRQQSRLVQKWLVLVVLTTLVIALPAVYIGGSVALSDSGMGDQIEDANLEFETHQQAIPVLQRKLALLSAKQEVQHLIKNRIEWPDVFQVLTNAAGDNVRFVRISASGGGVEGNELIEISLQCLAVSQTVARGYMVDLESTHIFDSVELVDTTREEIEDIDLVRFNVMIRVKSSILKASGVTSGG